MFSISWLEIVLITGIGILIYGLVRWVRWQPEGTDAVRTARGHALWTGALAYLASGITVNVALGRISNLATGPYQPQIWEPQRYPSQLWADLVIVLLPIVISLTIYLISQFTFPKPRGQVREATLSRRTVRDFLPLRLASFGTAIWLACAVIVGGIARLPGFSPVERSLDPANPDQLSNFSASSSFVYGQVDGWEVAIVLWAGLAFLALGVFGVMMVIARRRPLQGLSSGNNAALRTIAMNRLIRIAILASCGIASAAVQFAARRSGLVEVSGNAPVSIWSLPVGGFIAAGFLVFLIVVIWQPPKLDPVNGLDPSVPVPETAATRRHRAEADAVESSNAARVLVIVALVLGGLLVQFVVNSTGQFSPSLMALGWLFLGAVAQLFLLVGDSANWHLFRRRSLLEEPTRPWRSALFWWTASAALASIAVFVLCCLYVSLNVPGFPWLASAATGLTLLALTAVVVLIAVIRPKIPVISKTLDVTLRDVSAFRSVRLAAAALCASAAQLLTIAQSARPGAGMSYPWGVAALVLFALVLAVFPGPNRQVAAPATQSFPPSALRAGE